MRDSVRRPNGTLRLSLRRKERFTVQRSTPHRAARLGALLISIGLFAACGGGDDEDAGEAPAASSETTEASSETGSTEPGIADDSVSSTVDTTIAPTIEAPTTSEAESSSATADESVSDDDTGEMIEVDDFDDLPQHCRDAFADFLQQIEPTVSEIDWDTATMADFETLTTDLQAQSESFDEDMATAGCDQYEVGESTDSIQAMIDFAEQEAPGTVGYLEFLASFLEDLSGIDGSLGAADVPTDCAGAIAYMEELMAEHSTMTEMPINDMMSVSAVVSTIGTACPPAQSQEFFARDDVTAFLGA
jgi:hypothetical protein